MKRDGVLTIPYQSTEQVRTWVKAPNDPTTFSAEAGLAPTGEEDPAAWVPATWTGERLGNRYAATFTVPTLEKGKRYNVYIRVTAGGNVPVMQAGVIEAY